MPKLTIKLVGYVIAGFTALYAVWFIYDLLTGSDKIKAKLGVNQTDAAINSGKEAVKTIGDNSTNEDKIDKKTKETSDEIRDAVDAAAVDDALRSRLHNKTNNNN